MENVTISITTNIRNMHSLLRTRGATSFRTTKKNVTGDIKRLMSAYILRTRGHFISNEAYEKASGASLIIK